MGERMLYGLRREEEGRIEEDEEGKEEEEEEAEEEVDEISWVGVSWGGRIRSGSRRKSPRTGTR